MLLNSPGGITLQSGPGRDLSCLTPRVSTRAAKVVSLSFSIMSALAVRRLFVNAITLEPFEISS